MSEQSRQYAVEILGLGYFDGFPHPQLRTDPEFHGFDDHADAERALKDARQAYERLGISNIGKHARIVCRTTTVTRSDWVPLDEGVRIEVIGGLAPPWKATS